MARRFHGLKRAKIRASWNKYNLYNISRFKVGTLEQGTFYQQKWRAKSMSRAYHGEPIREGQWERMFVARARAVIPMDPAYMAEHDGSELAKGRGSGIERPLDLKKIRFRRKHIPYMSMTYAPIERRLDTAVFRSLFASSARQARLFCIAGKVKVNGLQMRFPGYLLNPGDMFQVNVDDVLYATGTPKTKEEARRSRGVRNVVKRRNRKIHMARAAAAKVRKENAPPALPLYAEEEPKEEPKQTGPTPKMLREQQEQQDRRTKRDSLRPRMAKLRDRLTKVLQNPKTKKMPIRTNIKLESLKKELDGVFKREQKPYSIGYKGDVSLQQLKDFNNLYHETWTKAYDLLGDQRFWKNPEATSLEDLLKPEEDQPLRVFVPKTFVLNEARIKRSLDKVPARIKGQTKAQNEERLKLAREAIVARLTKKKNISMIPRQQAIAANLAEKLRVDRAKAEVAKKIRDEARRVRREEETKKKREKIQQAELKRLQLHIKPYATPWTPRPYMSAFAFIPRYLEVHHAICSAVYLRHPVARPGFSEVPSPFPESALQLAHNWYLRRR